MPIEDFVIDTNVLISANGRPEDSIEPECVLECVQYLSQMQATGRVHLDSLRLILSEYRTYCTYEGQPGVGNQFFLWLHRNQANESRVCVTDITPNDEREFDEFPDSPALGRFDRSDRKFVATVLGCPDAPKIASAADSGWLLFQAELESQGVRLLVLCAAVRAGPSRRLKQ